MKKKEKEYMSILANTIVKLQNKNQKKPYREFTSDFQAYDKKNRYSISIRSISFPREEIENLELKK